MTTDHYAVHIDRFRSTGNIGTADALTSILREHLREEALINLSSSTEGSTTKRGASGLLPSKDGTLRSAAVSQGSGVRSGESSENQASPTQSFSPTN